MTRTSPIVSLAPSIFSSRCSVTSLVHSLMVQRHFHHPSSSSLTVSTSVGATMINQVILSHIHDLVDKHRLPLRFLITSRPESHIRETFDEPVMSSVTKVLSIYGDFGARRDVLTYLRDEFRRIQDSKRHKDIMQFVPKPWPSDRVIEQIAEKSGGISSTPPPSSNMLTRSTFHALTDLIKY
jgi:hypothetical protein